MYGSWRHTCSVLSPVLLSSGILLWIWTYPCNIAACLLGSLCFLLVLLPRWSWLSVLPPSIIWMAAWPCLPTSVYSMSYRLQVLVLGLPLVVSIGLEGISSLSPTCVLLAGTWSSFMWSLWSLSCPFSSSTSCLPLVVVPCPVFQRCCGLSSCHRFGIMSAPTSVWLSPLHWLLSHTFVLSSFPQSLASRNLSVRRTCNLWWRFRSRWLPWDPSVWWLPACWRLPRLALPA